MQPGDRLICAFIETKAVGSIFRDWPPHITIVPWFRTSIASVKLAEQLKASYVGSRPFHVSVLEEATFGYKKQKMVNLVEAPQLRKLEGQTRRSLHATQAWVVDEADKTRRGYRPHVTVLKAGRVHEGDVFVCDRLYIILQHGDYKQVDCEIIL